MPYASNGTISTDWHEGSIEITDDQYAEALAGMCSGLVVSVEGGFKVMPPFIPEPPAVPEPTPEQLKAEVIVLRDELLRIAAIRIAPLQDAIDLDDATPADIEGLKLWKQYRVALNRIEQQPGYPTKVTWPASPAA